MKYASNGIALECHDASKVRHKAKLKPHTLVRNPAGDWAFKFDVEFDFVLGDGRRIKGERRMTISRIVQIGRKPRA